MLNYVKKSQKWGCTLKELYNVELINADLIFAEPNFSDFVQIRKN